MKKNSWRSVAIFTLYFLILLAIALWVHDVPYKVNPFTTTLEQLVKTWGKNDPASYAKGALVFYSEGIRAFIHYWGLDVWPPGFMLLEGTIVKLFGLNTPIILVLQILAAGLFSLFMYLFYNLLKAWTPTIIALLIPLILFTFSMPRFFLLHPNTVIFGAGFAIGFFLIAMIFIFYSILKKKLRYAVYAGIFTALAAYFRPQFELFLHILTYWAILLALISVCFSPLRRYLGVAQIKNSVKIIAIIIIAFYLVTLPWRAVNFETRHYWRWVDTPSLTFRYLVMSSDFLNKTGGGWIVDGAGNLTCRINPKTCGEFRHAKKFTMKTFLKHIPTWYALKLHAFPPYWFSYKGALGVAEPYSNNHLSDYIANSVFLFTLVAAIGLMFSRPIRQSPFFLPLIWLNSGILLAHLGIVTFVHFEVRYFYFIKIYGIIMFILEATLLRYLIVTSRMNQVGKTLQHGTLDH